MRLTDIVRAGVLASQQGSPGRASLRGRPFPWAPLLLTLPAFVAIWGGWVGLGEMTGFGPINLLPGIGAHGFTLNTAITLPIGMEVYAAYALKVWLAGPNQAAQDFARRSAKWALAVGASGQVAYHLMASLDWKSAPWPITILVSCVPVAVLGLGAALYHLEHRAEPERKLPELPQAPVSPAPATGLNDYEEAETTPAINELETQFGPSDRWKQIQAIREQNPRIRQQEVADLLGVTARTVRNAIPEGERW